MSDRDNRAYLVRRAREERAAAEASADSGVALIHIRFAQEYERRAAQAVDNDPIELPHRRA